MPSTTCGWCGRFANMTAVGRDGRAVLAPSIGLEEFGQVFATFSCDYCGRYLLGVLEITTDEWARQSLDGVFQSELYESGIRWIPSQGEQPPSYEDVPDHIRAAARETHRCRSVGGNRAAALLARAVVEATAKAKGFSSGHLTEKIDRLHEAGFVREHVKDGAHEIRYLGNDMAHGDFVDPVEDEDVDLVLALMAEVLNDVFQSPARVARAKAKRDAKKAPQVAAPPQQRGSDVPDRPTA